MKKFIAALAILFAMMFAFAQTANAGMYIHRTDQLVFVNQSCAVGYGEAVSGKHLWVCTDVWALETYDGYTEALEGIGHLYCFLNGSNSSLVPCNSFSGSNMIDGEGTLVGGGLVTCGTGSGHGACSGNGITETVWTNVHYRCVGSDNYAAHYGKLGVTANVSSAVDGQANITGTVVKVQQYWGHSVELCFD